MKLTKTQLKKIIKEEFDSMPSDESPAFYILDAIQMLESEEDPRGTLFHVINQLHEALGKLTKETL